MGIIFAFIGAAVVSAAAGGYLVAVISSGLMMAALLVWQLYGFAQCYGTVKTYGLYSYLLVLVPLVGLWTFDIVPYAASITNVNHLQGLFGFVNSIPGFQFVPPNAPTEFGVMNSLWNTTGNQVNVFVVGMLAVSCLLFVIRYVMPVFGTIYQRILCWLAKEPYCGYPYPTRKGWEPQVEGAVTEWMTEAFRAYEPVFAEWADKRERSGEFAVQLAEAKEESAREEREWYTSEAFWGKAAGSHLANEEMRGLVSFHDDDSVKYKIYQEVQRCVLALEGTVGSDGAFNARWNDLIVPKTREYAFQSVQYHDGAWWPVVRPNSKDAYPMCPLEFVGSEGSGSYGFVTWARAYERAKRESQRAAASPVGVLTQVSE
ncbi:MAG: hypothetical protein ACYCRD_04840 [Leptospirillum sp.]